MVIGLVDDIAEYMSLEEIKEYLLEDKELTPAERFEVYYEEHDRVKREKIRKKEEKDSISYDDMMKDLGFNTDGDNNAQNKK